MPASSPEDDRIPDPVPPHPVPSFDYEGVQKENHIGSGGDADVYAATVSHHGSDYPVAIKEPRFHGTIQTDVVERFLSEADTWATLSDHENIVSVYAWDDQPLPWIGLEYMDGGPLTNRISDLTIDEALWLAGRIAEGIHHGHRHGVAHLDLKPDNILLRETPDGTYPYPKVSDWGLAKLLLDHSNSIEGLSPTYAAPEQFDSETFGRVDDLTDIYQFGTVLYELVTGQPPFTGPATDVMQSVLHETPQPPTAINTDVPPALDEIIRKALTKEKDGRYQGILPLLQDLDETFEDYVSDAPAPSPERSDSKHDTSTTGQRASGTASTTDASSEAEPARPETTRETPADHSSAETTSILVSRRALLGVLGGGTVGAGAFGIAQLGGSQQGDQPTTPTNVEPTRDQTPARTTEEPTETSTSTQNSAARADPELAKRWAAPNGTDYIWTVGSDFYCSGPGGAARTQQSHVVWTADKTIENGEYHLPDDSFGYNNQTVVFGFFADPGRDEPYSQAGAHFYAYGRESGTERWTLAAPDDGQHRQAVDATITEGIAALGCTDWARSDDLVYGVDAELGDVIWENSYEKRQLNAVVSYAEQFFLCFDSEVAVLDPNTGTETETRTIRTGDAIVSGNSLFTIDESVIVAYRLDESSIEWRGPTIENISTAITVDPSLVAVGTENGTVHALDRSSGERLWQGSITGAVNRIAVTPFNVWVRNAESGVFALDRDDGTVVHRSSHGSGGGIAVVDDILLMDTGGNITAYWIE